MYLLERQRKILGLLLANEQRMTGSQIAQMIGITDRTVRNDIKDLNEGLKEYPDSYVESIRGKGYLLVSKHKEELLKQVEQSNSNETTKGRLCNLALEILTVDEPILLDDLETDFFISRTPLETSIKCINEQCSQESKNNVIRRKNNAVYAECSEEERRSLIRKYIVLSSEYSGDFFRDEYGVLDKDYVKALMNHICRVLAKQGMQLTDKDMMEVVLFLYIQNMRILKEAYVTIADDKKWDCVPRMIRKIAEELVDILEKDMKVIYPEREVIFLAYYLCDVRMMKADRFTKKK